MISSSRSRAVLWAAAALAAAATSTMGQAPAQEAPPKPSPRMKGPNLIKPAPKADRKTAVQYFDPAIDARSAIEEKLRAAAADQRRVLVVWGDNTSPWTEPMFKALRVPDVATATLNHHEVVWVDVGDSTIGPLNSALAQTYGITEPIKAGDPPTLTVLESTGPNAGKVVAMRAGLVLADQRKVKAGQKSYNHLLLEDFLIENRPTPPIAPDVFRQAQERAKSRGVPVLLVFDEVADGWCVRFRRWMSRPEIKEALGAHFEVVRMDLTRMDQVFKVYEAMGGEKSQSSPWCVFTDAEGKKLAPAEDGSEDFGFPTDEEVPKFVAMLRRLSPKLTEEQGRSLEASLKAEIEPPAAAAPTTQSPPPTGGAK